MLLSFSLMRFFRFRHYFSTFAADYAMLILLYFAAIATPCHSALIAITLLPFHCHDAAYFASLPDIAVFAAFADIYAAFAIIIFFAITYFMPAFAYDIISMPLMPLSLRHYFLLPLFRCRHLR